MTEDERRASRSRHFEEEALPWLPDVTRYARSLARDDTDTDDVVQETFTRAFLAWDEFQPGTECRAWLFTICRNAFFRMRQRQQRQEAVTDPDLEARAAADVYMAARQDGLGSVFTNADLGDAISSAIDDLGAQFREAVMLVDVNDHSYEQASSILGVPIGTVRSRLFRARRLLQVALLDHARDAGFARSSQPIAPTDSPQ